MTEKKSLKLYAGAGLKNGVNALTAQFEKESGIAVEVDYGGSGMLISRIRVDQGADLFLPGDVWYIDKLQQQTGLIEAKTVVAYLEPVIIVAKNNPKAIFELNDLFKPGLNIALGNFKACQIGRVTQKIFKKNGLDIAKLNPKESLTVNELGVWVKMGDVDAAIVWNITATNLANELEQVIIPQEKNIRSKVVIGLLSTSDAKEMAQRFIDFMISRNGREILKKYGYIL
jgi:molybdate transport system substrate-binding protein